MSAPELSPRSTRRELVSRGIATVAAASVLSASLDPPALASADTDAQVLAATLTVEQIVLVAYHQALASGSLEPATARLIGRLVAQEHQHISTLSRDLIRLGGRPPSVPADLASVQKALSAHHVPASLTDLPTQRDCLSLLIDVETLVEGAYYAAISKLHDPGLLASSAAIMASEAQHWTLLSAAKSHGDVSQSVPYAFVQGA